MVCPFGIARSDVPRDAFVETEFGEETEGGGQTLLAVQPFFFGRFESRRLRQLERCGWSDDRGVHCGSGPEIASAIRCSSEKVGQDAI